MPTNEKKGITVKIDAELHAEVRQYLEQHSMTMADFVTMALQDELHPKIEQKEEKSMEKMRTLAFQVPEDLFQKIKDYLHRNNMTQRQFVIGLIENEIERDLTERQAQTEAQEPTEDQDEEETEELTEDAAEEEYEDEIEESEEELEDEELTEDEESEEEELTEDEEETEGMVMRM
ncbi:MAG: hypothetical protein J6D11_07715 [Clostridia bacterium]|nr:hypothetical protein [Clostridia bacterium]